MNHNVLRTLGSAAFTLALTSGLVACGDSLGGLSSTQRYADRITGEPCTPDFDSLGTSTDALTSSGSGDNMDDEHSGQVDCRGDGDSGEGNDGSCDGSSSDDDGSTDDGSNDGSDDSSDDGSGDGSSDSSSDGSGDEPVACDANGCCEAP